MRWLGMLLLFLGFAPAVAAAPSCRIPSDIAAPHSEGPSEREPRRTLPIGGYTLALIWGPQHCRTEAPGFDCAAHRGGFVLHGLWPDGTGRDWPQWCRPADALAPATIRAAYCATPAPQLIQHEWAKHGTCMPGLTPERYFALSGRLYGTIASPDMRALSYRRLTAHGFAAAFARANPGLSADMVRLNLDRRGWLEEVWLCLDTAFGPRRCPAAQGGAYGDERVMIWRGDTPDRMSRGRRAP